MPGRGARVRGGMRGERVGRTGRHATRRGAVRRSRRALTARTPVDRARSHLRAFRKAGTLAVALTGFLLLFADPDEGRAVQAQAGTDAAVEEIPDTVAIIEQVPVEALQRVDTPEAKPDSVARESAVEATRTLRDLFSSFYGFLPKLAIALAIFLVAGVLVKLIRPLMRRALASFSRAEAYTALIGIAIWLLAVGVAFSVMAGDITALLGSLGLIGLALSWALQTPIESFTGWLLNSFRGYYRVGDRISVGDVFGDVYNIDLLTTTVWEYGGADRPPGFIRAEQPTGRLITFPNNEILAGTVVNYTRDFPYVWDELSVAVANESELRYTMEVLRRVALELLGDRMSGPAQSYQAILANTPLESQVSTEPQVFVSLQESWTDVTIRYLVGAREKRKWKSELTLRVVEELARPEHQGKILPVYPRRQLQWIDAGGAPRDGPGG